MIKTGVDIVEISRIERLIQNSGFPHRLFTEREREWIASKPHRAAGCFAAKEATAKALGTGIRGFSFCDIEISHDALGAPFLILHGGAKAALGDAKLSLSISHSELHAVAFVVLYDDSVSQSFK
ncbi:MAG: holo-ACP synthase [Bacillota bacterium]|nr:holo-ACP synthase [Bacillota bacterium]